MTTYKQTRDANLSITKVVSGGNTLASWDGYCLAVARTIFNIPAVNGYGSATDSWEKSNTKHADYNPPEGVYVPLYWSGGSAHGQNNVGHIAIAKRTGDKIEVWSSPYTKEAKLRKFEGKTGDILNYITKTYGMTKYVGWTCDINGYTVIEKVVEKAAESFVLEYPTASGGQASFSAKKAELDTLTAKIKARAEKMNAGDTVSFVVRGK